MGKRSERAPWRAGYPILALALILQAFAATASDSARRWDVAENAFPLPAPVAAPAIELAQAEEAEEARDSRPLEPRYQPREPEKKSWYNGSYIFGMTRGVAGSTIAPAGKVPLFVLTVPLDIAFLPFAAIGGLFG